MRLEPTPEKQWDKIKKMIFKNKVPENIENAMQKGFNKDFSEDDKWGNLAIMLLLIPSKRKKNG